MTCPVRELQGNQGNIWKQSLTDKQTQEGAEKPRSGRRDNASTNEGRGHRGCHTCVAQGSLVHILSFPMAKPWALISLLKNLLMVLSEPV